MARDNGQTNAHVYGMLPNGYYHIGRGLLFIIWHRLPKALGLIMATEHAFIFSICSTSVSLNNKEITQTLAHLADIF